MIIFPVPVAILLTISCVTKVTSAISNLKDEKNPLFVSGRLDVSDFVFQLRSHNKILYWISALLKTMSWKTNSD